MAEYVLAIDQSTQGTKGLLFDGKGDLICRADRPHRQIINEKGWVEHDPEEIFANVLGVVRDVVEKAGIDRNDIAGLGISNQRETSAAWYRDGSPVCNAIVWQCARAAGICERIEKEGFADKVLEKTGIRLSPYFPAGKLAWIMENVDGARERAAAGEVLLGTMDTYVLYRLTGGRVYRTDYSNASRTQLFNINTLEWDEELCRIFGIPAGILAQVTDSDGDYGETDFGGYLEHPIPIRGVMGDSHAALFGQGCREPGMTKATYGTGSSVMMNIGERPARSSHGVVTSLAWCMDGKVNYCLEGNINYTGAVITWLKDDLKLIGSAKETQELAESASPEDRSYLVPAFTGLGAPYWDSDARAVICGMSRTTRRAEIVRDALECIGYQITDILRAMEEDAGVPIRELRADGGPTGNRYLMQFQSDIARVAVTVPPSEELSGMGAAYATGIRLGIYDPEKLFAGVRRTEYQPQMPEAEVGERYSGWKVAVRKALS